jgi:flagellar biosynthesis/type III secretory pathway chaperone
MMSAILDRLETVLAAETKALARGGRVDLRQFTLEKNQLLLEITRTRQGRGAPAIAGNAAGWADRLKIALSENERALKVHLDAAKQVSAIIVEAMREAESDGTYSPAWYLPGRR